MKFYNFLIVLSLFLGKVFAQEKLPSDSLPILAWLGVPEKETSLERFQELKASGININFSSYSGLAAAQKALDIAAQVGIKVLVSCPELKSDPEGTVKRLMKHSALAGYYLQDEPGAKDFPELEKWTKRIQAVDKQHFCYINLFPNYASAEQLFGESDPSDTRKDRFAEYVDRFLDQVPVPFLSFDHYPVIENNAGRSLRPGWYKNLEIAMAASQKRKMPMWAFALAVAHDPYPIPTIGELKVQMYSNLAYGAQVLQYFTYWNPGVNPSWDFHDAPIGLDGKRTIVYDRVKVVNEELQKMAGVFVGAKVVSVAHTGDKLPAGTKRLDVLPEPVKILETGKGGAVVSLLEKGSRQFLVIVNRDFQNPMDLIIAADSKVRRVLKDGSLVNSSVYNSKTQVDPGDAVIYTWEK